MYTNTHKNIHIYTHKHSHVHKEYVHTYTQTQTNTIYMYIIQQNSHKHTSSIICFSFNSLSFSEAIFVASSWFCFNCINFSYMSSIWKFNLWILLWSKFCSLTLKPANFYNIYKHVKCTLIIILKVNYVCVLCAYYKLWAKHIPKNISLFVQETKAYK